MSKARITSHFKNEILKIRKHHRLWLMFSSISIISSILIFLSWSKLENYHSETLLWSLIIIGIITSIIWWIWTMNIIGRMLHYQYDMINILSEITNDIKEIKVEVKRFLK